MSQAVRRTSANMQFWLCWEGLMFCQRALECCLNVTGIRGTVSGNVCSKSVTPNASFVQSGLEGLLEYISTHILILSFTSAYTPEGGQWAKNIGRQRGSLERRYVCFERHDIIWPEELYVQYVKYL